MPNLGNEIRIYDAKDGRVARVEMKLEVVVISVSYVDRREIILRERRSGTAMKN